MAGLRKPTSAGKCSSCDCPVGDLYDGQCRDCHSETTCDYIPSPQDITRASEEIRNSRAKHINVETEHVLPVYHLPREFT